MKVYFALFVLLVFGQFAQAASGWSSFEGTYRVSRYQSCSDYGGTDNAFCNTSFMWNGVEVGDLDSFQIAASPHPHVIFKDRSGKVWSSESIDCEKYGCQIIDEPYNPRVEFEFYTPEGRFYFTSYREGQDYLRIYPKSKSAYDLKVSFTHKTNRPDRVPLQKWSPIYKLGSDLGVSAFVAMNDSRQTLLPSATTSSRRPSLHATNRPMAWGGDQYVEMPDLTTALFKGKIDQEYYAVSLKALYFKSARATGWNQIKGFPSSVADLRYPHFFLDAQNQVLAFVGYDERTPVNSHGRNTLVIWNFKTGESKDIHIGTGFDGMSSLVIIPDKKIVVTASMNVQSWNLNLTAYDFAGSLVSEYPQINNYFHTQKLYRGWASDWEWGVDLGLDTKTQELLVQYRPGFGSSNLADLEKAKIYRVDISSDQVIGEEQP